MAMIAMAVHDTADNGRTKYTQETLLSLYDTVDWNKHHMVIINNNSCIATNKILTGTKKSLKNITVINLSENVGTARAINMAIRLRLPNEVVVKMDNDVVVHQSDWVDEMESAIEEWPYIGILGLKRDDVYGDFIKVNKYLMCDDIMGTCTAYNPKMLDKCGYLSQPSVYGFDDVIFSARSLAAGFRNAFLPHIKITHLDDGLNPYCDWKKREACLHLQNVSIMCDMIKQGKIDFYYDGQFDD